MLDAVLLKTSANSLYCSGSCSWSFVHVSRCDGSDMTAHIWQLNTTAMMIHHKHYPVTSPTFLLKPLHYLDRFPLLLSSPDSIFSSIGYNSLDRNSVRYYLLFRVRSTRGPILTVVRANSIIEIPGILFGRVGTPSSL